MWAAGNNPLKAQQLVIDLLDRLTNTTTESIKEMGSALAEQLALTDDLQKKYDEAVATIAHALDRQKELDAREVRLVEIQKQVDALRTKWQLANDALDKATQAVQKQQKDLDAHAQEAAALQLKLDDDVAGLAADRLALNEEVKIIDAREATVTARENAFAEAQTLINKS